MAAPHKAKQDRVEFNSARHKAMNVDPDWLKAKHYENTEQTPLTDMDPPLLGPMWMEPKFALQLSGSGAAGTAPPCGVLLEDACGMTKTIVADTSVTYKASGSLVAAGVAIDLYQGNGLRFRSTSTVLNARFTLKPGEPCIVEFEGSGLSATPTEASGSASLPTQANPIVCKGLTVTIASQALIMKELIIDLGNEHNGPWEDLASSATNGCQAPLLIDQMPIAEALIVVPALATLNAWTDMIANSYHALSAALGSTAGNIATITARGYPREKPELIKQDGVLCARLKYRIGKASAEVLTIAFT